MADNSDILGLNQSGGMVPSVSGDSYESMTQDDREQLRQAHSRNVALGLLAAGLATMSARPRDFRSRVTPLEALGQGGLAGIETYGAGEASAQKAILARRQAELERQKLAATIGQTEELRQIQAQTAKERERHDTALEKLTQQQRDIQSASQRSMEQFRGAEEKHWGVEEGIQRETAGSLAALRAGEAQQYQPGGRDTLSAFRKAKGLPPGTPSPDEIKAMPLKDALAMQREVYRAMATATAKKNVRFQQLKDGWHKIVTDPTTGDTISDSYVGQAAPKGGAGLSPDAAAEIGAATGGTTPPSSTTPTPAATPTAPMGPPPGKIVGKTTKPDNTYYMGGKKYIAYKGQVYEQP
jgi:hypothetical protein